jgi:hypothetical protein
MAAITLTRTSLEPLPGPGVPPALAGERARRVSELRSGLHFGVPEAMDGRDARGPQLHERRADGQAASELAARRLPGPSAQDHPHIGGRSVPGHRPCAVSLYGLLLLAVAPTTHVQDADNADQDRCDCKHVSDLPSRLTEGNRGTADGWGFGWRRVIL